MNFHIRELRRGKLFRNKQFILRAKSKPCADCGVQYNPWIMQFDHREPSNKEFELGDLRKCYSLKRVQHEIDKCDVVCANCHLDRTYRYKHWLTRRKFNLNKVTENPQGAFSFYDIAPLPHAKNKKTEQEK